MLDIEYIADSINIESFARSDQFIKTADAGVLSWISSKVQDAIHWDPNNPGASLLSLSGQVLFYTIMPWWLGVLVEAGMELLGLNPTKIVEDILKKLAEMMNNGDVKSKGISQAVNSVVDEKIGGGSSADDGQDKIAESRRVFAESRRVFAQMTLLKQTINDQVTKTGGVATEVVKEGLSKFVPLTEIKGFIAKILKFLFKTLLMKTAAHYTAAVAEPIVGPAIRSIVTPKKKLKSTNFGETKEDPNWAAPVRFDQIPNLIMSWVYQAYPELGSTELKNKTESAVAGSGKFRTLLQEIRSENSQNNIPNSTFIPLEVDGKSIRSKADVVNFFIEDVANQIGYTTTG